ncbi:MAG: HD domain-containing protein [Patescibacteria group bacterium]|nr:HD domain-containing protein [Patescibacteria group bacterium]
MARLSQKEIEKIRKEVIKIYNKNNDPFHHYNHALKTAELAKKIAQKEGADKNICYVAGLVHDLAPKKRSQPHGENSRKIANKLLNKIGLDKEVIYKIGEAIRYHDTRNSHKIKTLEGKIIFDAGKLQCYGPVGIIREYGDLLIKGYPHEKAINKLLDYLKNFKPKFFTKTGQKIRKKLKKYNQEFIKLFKEYY